MAARTYHVPVLPHWHSSPDVLLAALAANGGELYSAMDAVQGVVDDDRSVPIAVGLQYTRVTDEGIEALAGLTGVTRLESSGHMTDASLVHRRGMASLEQLTLNKMRVTGDGLRHLAAVARLDHLQLCDCTLTDAALSHLPALPRLTGLNLSGSSGCTTAALECLTRLPGLRGLSLNGAPAAGEGLRHLAAMPRLTSLDLSGGGERMTTDADLAHVPPLASVEQLGLSHTYVTDAGVALLARLPGLKSLDLSMTDVGDECIRHLTTLPRLEWVNLDYTRVSGRGVRELHTARPGIWVSASLCTGDPPPGPEDQGRRTERSAVAPVAAVSDWQTFLSRFEIERGELSPVPRTRLTQYEEQTGFTLPRSYCEFCETFGPGELRCMTDCEVHVPSAEMRHFNLERLNTVMRTERPTSGIADLEQYSRAVFFGSNMYTDSFFWDPHDVTDRAANEYGVYVLHRDQTVERLADSFWAFVTDYCIRDGEPGVDFEYRFDPAR